METNGTPTGETASTEQVKNNAQTPPTTVTPDELEALKKAKEQAEMRARQLENEKQAREKADEDARLKQLEEQEEYKTLYERTQADLQRLQDESARLTKETALKTSESTILSSYGEDVKEIVATTGLVLTDDTDEAKESFKKKLDNLAEKFGTKPRVQGNNRAPQTPHQDDEQERAQRLNRMRYSGDGKAIAEKARFEAISSLSSIQAMREAAGLTPEEF